MANDHHGDHGRSCNEQRYAADPGNKKTPARAILSVPSSGKTCLAVITHIGIFVHFGGAGRGWSAYAGDKWCGRA